MLAPLDAASLGFSPFFENEWRRVTQEQGRALQWGRVVAEYRGRYELVLPGRGTVMGRLAGRARRGQGGGELLPTVGDFVLFEAGEEVLAASAPLVTVEAMLPRKSALIRAAAGKRSKAQAIAANIDTIFVLCGLDGELNLKRIERYAALIEQSGAKMVLLLTKADLCVGTEAEDIVEEVLERLPGRELHCISALAREGLEPLMPYLALGQTVALVGSSGTGKSTLANALLGEALMATGEVRASDGRGRHTTTYRKLFAIPGGGLFIDTPGMRELAMWGDVSEVEGSFDDLAQLATQCRFGDCRHLSEPGCAVLAAVEEGRLDEERLESFQKLAHEAAAAAHRADAAAVRAEGKRFGKTMKEAIEERARKRRW